MQITEPGLVERRCVPRYLVGSSAWRIFGAPLEWTILYCTPGNLWSSSFVPHLPHLNSSQDTLGICQRSVEGSFAAFSD